jgi:nitrite reductase/ring-hydroxylating ferredoxin subunit
VRRDDGAVSAPTRPSERLDAILDRGEYVVLSNEADVAATWREIRVILDGEIVALAGDETRLRIADEGLVRLHELLPAERIGEIRDAAMARIRPILLETALRVGRDVLGLDGEFFVDDYTILRVNYPYEVAVRASADAENPGIGRVAGSVAGDLRRTRVVDPVYSPRAYHRDQPPASWAHGPHMDTWTGHSRRGINLWWALDDVVAENSMFIFPELFGEPLEPDPRSLYLRPGIPLPRPTPLPLRAGQLLLFNPEVLHGTHLNVSGQTRVALSTRINAQRPTFDPACFYAREFWHSSTDLAAGRFEDVIRFPRAEHLEAPADKMSVRSRPCPRVSLGVALEGAGWVDVCAAAEVPAGARLAVDFTDGSLLLVGTTRGVRAIGAHCPHLGTDLADGFHDDSSIHCPAHAMRYDLDSGVSACSLLRLPTARVEARGERLFVRAA